MTPETKPDDHRAADEFSVFIPPRARRAATRSILFAGVAGACVLGVGLGLWARPAMNERQAAAALPAAQTPKAPAAARQLQIVVDDRPAPIGAPIDVLPAASAARSAAPAPVAATVAAPPPSGPLFAPTRPPQGLMRVQDVTPAEPPPTPPLLPPQAAPAPIKAHPARDLAALVITALASHPEPAAKPVAAPSAHPTHVVVAKTAVAKTLVAKARAAPPKAAPVRLAKAETPAKPDRKAELARAATARAAAHKLELAQAAKQAKAERQEELRLARAQKQEQIRLAAAHRLEKDRLAKAAHQQQVLLAQAEARGRAAARAEALAQAKTDARNQIRLASLVHAVQRAMAQPAKPHAQPPPRPPAELARLDRRQARKLRHEAQVEHAALRTRKAAHVVQPAPRTHAVQPVAPPPHASGLMRVSTPRCANRDPGEALVCADPALGAADRQLARAYQGARAAGVSDAQLQRQQQHWLAARASAAREAPWAVHDVYLARIAELNGQAKEAHNDGY